MSILKKIAIGGVWNAIAQFSSQFIGLVITVVLARLLLPEDFGLIGKVTVLTGFIGYFVELGFTPSLILFPGDEDETVYHSTFWGSLALSVFFYISVYFLSPYIARFYSDDRLIILVRILFLDFLFRPFTIIPTAIESKALRYDKIAKSNLIGAIMSGILAFGLAFAGFGVWALVVQIVSRTLFVCITLLILTKWFPAFKYKWNHFKIILKNGVHFTLENILKYTSENVDFLLVGKLLSDTALGVYTLAFRLTRYLISKLWTVFGRIFFPAFVSVKQNEISSRLNYLKLSVLMSLIVLPVLSLYFLLIDELVIIIIGEKWKNSVQIVKILIPYIAFESLCVTDPGLIAAQGKVYYTYTIRFIITMIIGIGGYFIVGVYGLIGISVLYTATYIIGFTVQKLIALKMMKITLINYFACLREIFLLLTLDTIAVYSLKYILLKFFDNAIIIVFSSIVIWAVITLIFLLYMGYFNGTKPDFKRIFMYIDCRETGRIEGEINE